MTVGQPCLQSLRRIATLALFAAMSSPAAFAVLHTPGQSGVDRAGNAEYAIPIATPPGTGGVVPNLTLSYNSSDTNGHLGVGWRLGGLSSIVRCPATIATENTVGGVRLDSMDRFCLDGQKLVAVGSGVYGADGTEYRTESESFTKVISYGSAGGGPAWFKVWTKSGLIKEFGNSADSRLEPPGSSVPHTWALNKLADRSGNYYLVSYNENLSTGEASISRIDYTGNAGTGGSLPFASVRFEYEARPDGQSAYISTYLVRLESRLAHIKTFVGEQLVRDYRMTYGVSPSTGRSRLVSLVECSASGACLVPTSIAWRDGGGSSATISAGAPGSYITKVLAGDFNGDGIQDAFIVKQGAPSLICLGPQLTGTQNCSEFVLWTGSLADVGDVDGNGTSEIIIRSSDGYAVVCFGPTFTDEGSCPVLWAPYSITLPDYQFVVGDFTGDGRADAFFWSPSISMYCDLSAILANPNVQCGGSTNVPGPGGTAFPGRFEGDGTASVRRADSSWTNSYSTVVGDFNGDGKSDLFRASATGLQFCPGPGILSGDNCQNVAGATGDWKAAFQLVSGDFNGDGISDLLLAAATGTILCPGPGITTSVNCVPMNASNWRNAFVASGDFNGDSTADIYVAAAGQGFLATGGAGTPDLISSVTDGLGATASYQYKPLTDAAVYTKGTGAVYPTRDSQMPAHVVSKACRSDGIGGNACSDYQYWGARLNLAGRGFMGFEKIKATDLQAGRYTMSTFSQVFPFVGQPATIETYVGEQQIKRVAFAYAMKPSFETRQFPATTSVTDFNNGLDGAWKSETRFFSFDTYGNHSNVTTNISNSPTLIESKTLTYDIDVANWILGNLKVKTVQRAYYLQSAITRRTEYSYVPGTLLVSQEIVEPQDAALRVQSDYARDVFGNVTSKAVSAQGIQTRTSTWSYDPHGRFATTTTNPLGHVSTSTFDERFGGTTSITDANGLTSTITFDAFGRKTLEVRPDGAQHSFAYVACSGCASLAGNAAPAYYVADYSTGNTQPSLTYYDLIGRRIAKSVRNLDDTDWLDEGVAQYDAAGRKVRSYLPHFRSAATKPYSLIAYDARGRVSTVTAPDQGVTAYTYSEPPAAGPISTTVVNARGFGTTTVRDFLGQVVQVVDANNKLTTYEYDPFGNPSKVTDPLGNQSTSSYDTLGRQTARNDPDLGHWTFTYDPLGQLSSQTDAKSQLTTFVYDKLGRRTQRSELSMTANWTWDTATKGIGKIASSFTNEGVSRSYLYDVYGRPSTQTLNVDGVAYSTTTTYDAAGRPEVLTYPSGFAVKNVYNGVGYLSEVRNSATNALYWFASAQGPAGLTVEVLGNATAIVRVFDENTQKVSQIAAFRDSDSSILQHHGFGYDLVGNMSYRVELNQGVTETFAFDSLDRITGVAGPAPKTFTYNDIGNILSKSDVGTYSYPTSGKVHAVSSAGGVSYSYDLNGNLVTSGSKAIAWTSFNMPASVQVGGNAYSWLYDPDRRRVKYSMPLETTIYVAADTSLLFEKVTSGGVTQQRHYVYANGKAVAQYTQRSVGASDTRYFYRDHLGSTTLVLDELGNVAERLSYDAQARRRFPSGADDSSGTLSGTTTDRGFTWHEHLDEIGFIHMNGRIYDPRIGRFASADPTVPDQDDLQNWNRFSYVLNNPLRYVDPSGYIPRDPFDPYSTPGCSFCFSEEEDEEDSGDSSEYEGGLPATSESWTGSRVSFGYSNPVVSDSGGWAPNLFTGFGDGAYLGATFGALGSLPSIRDRLGIVSRPEFDSLSYRFGHGFGELVGMGATVGGSAVAGSRGLAAVGNGNVFRGPGLSIRGREIAIRGDEIRIGQDVRIAPFGNHLNRGTVKPLSRIPHYHRRGNGPGQGIGRHRPYETSPDDRSIRDRF